MLIIGKSIARIKNIDYTYFQYQFTTLLPD